MTSFFRKAYSVVGVVLLLQYALQLYLVAAAIFTVVAANDEKKDLNRAFSNADSILGLHMGNGDLAALMILVLIGCSFGSRYRWRTTGWTALLFPLIVAQSFLAHTGIPFLSALHGLNALVLIGLTIWLTWTNWAFTRQPESSTRPSRVYGEAAATGAEG